MNSNYVLPITIVVAGLLIAGAVFLVGKNQTTTPNNNGQVAGARQYDPAVDHLLGNPQAPVKVVEYMDLECPHCKIFEQTMHQIMDNYGPSGKVAWVSRPFPLAQIHSKAPARGTGSRVRSSAGRRHGVL
jgi:protein-disulfide isomerase